MKLALVVPPAEEELSLDLGSNQNPSPALVESRCKSVMLLISGIMAVIAVVAICIFVWRNMTAHAGNKAIAKTAKPAEATAQSKWRIAAFDISQTLKRGDSVVVHRDGMSGVWQVAASANDSVVLNRGDVNDGLYVMGDNSYVVTSGKKVRILRATDILALVEPAPGVAEMTPGQASR